MSKEKTAFNQRCYGLVIIKSEHSNFNADFTGNPRRLPDNLGTIYGTDKALKYPIRKFWVNDDKDVFVWRSHQENGNVRTRDERMEQMINVLVSKDKEFKQFIDFKIWLEKNSETFKDKDEIEQIENEEFKKYFKSKLENVKKIDKKSIKSVFDEKMSEVKSKITATVFAKCIDTKLFGVTYTGEGPLSLTGPVQISYGVNRFKDNTNYINDILSPYPTGDEGTTQSSIGKEVKNLESYYVYDFSINPKNIITHYNDREDIQTLMQITTDDIDDLKKAMKYGVTALDTTSKIGSENALLLFITLPESSEKFLPAMKNLVEITKTEDGKAEIDLSKVEKLISDEELSETIELCYNENVTEVIGNGTNWTIDKKM